MALSVPMQPCAASDPPLGGTTNGPASSI